MKSNFK